MTTLFSVILIWSVVNKVYGDHCKIPIIYYASVSRINSYNTLADNTSSSKIFDSSGSKLVYDKHNHNILVYNSSNAIYNVRLDGLVMEILATDEKYFQRFAYDGRRKNIYYVHKATQTIRMLNLTNMEDVKVKALANIHNIRGVDIDVLNDCLVIVTPSQHFSLVFYDLGQNASVRFISYNGGYGQSLYVVEDGTIYWTIFELLSYSFRVLSTTISGVTTELGISYKEEIVVAADELYLYILEKRHDHVDIYSKKNLRKVREVFLESIRSEMIIGIDIDECCFNDTCHVKATCSNTPGTFVCTCFEGYEASGVYCKDINECEHVNYCKNPNVDCVNTEGSFYCTCSSGFTGNGIICTDIDECQFNNTCHINAICSNTIGSFNCVCSSGFKAIGSGCEDINECDLSYCDPNARCVNTEGSFHCNCRPGYTGNGFNCTETCEQALLLLFSGGYKYKYDKYNRRLLLLDSPSNDLFSLYLNLTVSTKLINNIRNVTDYTYDGSNRILYYLNGQTLKIHSLHMSNGNDKSVQALSRFSDIQALEMDTKNRFLIIARSSDPPILRFHTPTSTTFEEHFNGSAQELSVDQDDEVVYWDNVIGKKHNLFRTFYAKETENLNITYDGRIALAQDYFHLYVLDLGNKRLDIYLKRTLKRIASTSVVALMAQQLIIAFDYDECCVGTYCPETATCTNAPSSFTCKCNEGYFVNGSICQDVNECEKENGCHVNATCTNTIGSYKCTCMDGTKGDGRNNCTDIDECMVEGFCDVDKANCNNTYGSYNCECFNGFTGDGKHCIDINECDSKNYCHDDATCINTIGSYNCSCQDGFLGNGTYCQDIDECSLVTNKCDVNRANCTNTLGSYTCQCVHGYTGDGRDCKDINECNGENYCHDDAVCINTIASYNCSCRNGFQGNGTDCKDIDECSLGIDRCSLSAHAYCSNMPGSYTCQCIQGYTGDGIACKDLDECAIRDGNNCSANANCTNTFGLYTCHCLTGFAGNGFVCTDINECDGENDCHDDAACINTIGSYDCSCRNGFLGNGTYCQDLDECAVGDGKNSCSANANCTNTFGSYTCQCWTGFAGNGFVCTDIDECALGVNHCDKQNGRCSNVQGSYICTCKTGYSGDGKNCQDIDECELDMHACDKENGSCSNMQGSYICTCKDGYSGDGKTCRDIINPCLENSCGKDATCRYSNASFTCTCNLGYTGDGLDCLGHKNGIGYFGSNHTSPLKI
ncbi:fibrillin-1-like [Dendronephthya gigantea]|uniref:fibrillin-1-like n=1 Tax=Dendronephthya gigantea TaxID=151771 RepID=UPI00106A3236|nr:fibrillin-1-like [Dendronephthya gigantea]